MLAFESSTHTYTWRGRVVPSVTQILGPFYDWSMVDRDLLERKRDIGVAVHAAVELDLEDNLDEASLDPACAPYFAAWKRFRAEMGFSTADVGSVEERFYHPAIGYAGTPDLTVYMGGRWSVLDVKTAEALSPVWALQTAAYRELLNANTGQAQHKIEKRFSLRLLPDGTYRLNEHKNPGDFTVFLSALNCWKWRAANLANGEANGHQHH